MGAAMKTKPEEWVSLCPDRTTCPDAFFSTDRVTIRHHGVAVELTSGQLKILIEEARKRGLHQG